MQIDDLEQYLSHKKHIIHTPEVRKRNNYPQKEARQKIVKEILAAWNTEIEEAGRIIKDLNTLGHLTSNNRLLKLLYFINLTQLSHIKRKVRLHGEAAGIEPALSMLDNSKLFIQNLYNKLTKGYV